MCVAPNEKKMPRPNGHTTHTREYFSIFITAETTTTSHSFCQPANLRQCPCGVCVKIEEQIAEFLFLARRVQIDTKRKTIFL